MANGVVREENNEFAETGFRIRHIFYFAAAVLVFLAIFSYSPADAASITGGVNAPPTNWVGNLGAWLGYWFFNLCGLAVYAIVLLTLLKCARAILPGKGRPLLFLTGELLMVFGIMLLLALSPSPFAFLTERLGIGRMGAPELALSGGVIGQVLAAPPVESLALSGGALRSLIGAVGTMVIGWALVLGGLIAIYFSDWHRLLCHYVYSPALAAAADRQQRGGEPEEPRSAKRVPEAEDEDEPEPEVPPRERPASGGLFGRAQAALEALRRRHRDEGAKVGEPEPMPDDIPDEDEDEPVAVAAPERPQPVAPAVKTPVQPVGIPEVGTRVVEKGQKAEPVYAKDYVLPPITMLSKGEDTGGESPEAIVKSREILQRTLESFKVQGRVSDYISGPRITRYEISLEEGINVKKVEALADNMAMNLSAKSVRVLAPIPGRPVVGVEVPNATSEAVFMRAVMESPAWKEGKADIPIVLGKDVAGKPVILDLAKAPHLLIAGSTGSGKSVMMNTLIMSLLFKFPPDELRLIMVDPKIVEFEDYKPLPHLITPVINNSAKVPVALRWAVNEMEKRYQILARAGVKKLSEFNKRPIPEAPELDDDGIPLPAKMPVLVVIIDELAELMMTDARKDSETYIARIAQLGRAAGVHIVVATQRPSTQIITGVIKANLPTRIAFRVGQMVDSRVILDANGAEKLLGMGDMLYMSPGGMDLERVQGAWVKDADIKQVVKFVSDQAPQSFDKRVVAEEEARDEDDEAVGGDDDDDDDEGGGMSYQDLAPMVKKYLRPGDDDVVRKALEVVLVDKKASTSYLQRRLGIGYNSAAKLIDLFEERGIVGPPSGSGNKRDILVFDEDEFQE